ncbi:MAG: hypothetical protein HRF45_06270 [Fimbriimonadia bacterium]
MASCAAELSRLLRYVGADGDAQARQGTRRALGWATVGCGSGLFASGPPLIAFLQHGNSATPTWLAGAVGIVYSLVAVSILVAMVRLNRTLRAAESDVGSGTQARAGSDPGARRGRQG